MSKKIKVEAVEVGFFDGHTVQVGTIFELDDKCQMGKWMKVIKAEKSKAKPKKIEPTNKVEVESSDDIKTETIED
jgi:hypothetical protein